MCNVYRKTSSLLLAVHVKDGLTLWRFPFMIYQLDQPMFVLRVVRLTVFFIVIEILTELSVSKQWRP